MAREVSHLMTFRKLWTSALILSAALLVPGSTRAFAQQPATQTKKSTTDSSKSTAATKPSQADIDAAKAAGKVWVNTSSGIYFKSGQYYGNTKQWKFMTEEEAKKAGYRAAKNEK